MIDLRSFVPPASLDALALTLIHFLWQGALLGSAAFFALRIVRPEQATTRYAIGVATLGAMLVTTIATFAILSREPLPAGDRAAAMPMSISAPSPSGSTRDAVVEVVDTRGAHSMTDASPTTASWPPAPLGPAASSLVVMMWALGVFALSLRLLGGWMLTRRLARHAVMAVAPAVTAAAGVIANRLQLRRAVAVVESGAVVVPTLVGWITPVVLLPAVALSGLSPEQLQAILAHELAHVRRHDYLINLLQSMVETLLFYHPALWWVSAQVRAEREHCCDDLAVEVCGDRLVYVSALAELTMIANHRAFALAATDGSLVSRVQRILGRPRAMHEPTPAWAVIALFVLIIGGVGSFRSAAAETATLAALDKKAVDRQSKARLVEHPQLSKTLKKPSEAVASFTGQWFRNWVEPPPAPPAPPAPEAPPAPPAPPAPYAPEAPPAPPAPPELMQDLGTHGSGNMTWSSNGEKVSVKWNGGFRLSDDEKDIAWVEDGATVNISDGILIASRVELRGANGHVERTFTKNGFRREWEPEGRLFLASAIDKLIRHSAAFAKERVARFLKQGGPDAVLAEIARLGDSSYVHRVYYTELAKQADLSDSLLGRILQRVPSELSSDYDKATLLTMIAKQPAITDAHRVSIARAVKSISSNYDQRRTLDAIMTTRPLSPAVAAAILEGTETISSNYDRSLVLSAVAERGGLTAATSTAFMDLVKSMGSSYDQRRVLTAVAAQGSLPDAVAVDAIKSAGAISSSYDQAETLTRLIDRGGVNDASADSFFQAVGQISSSYDMTRVLKRVADQASMSERVLEGVLRTAAKISSGHDRANLLEAVAGKAKVTGIARELYLSAARGLGNYDENRALASLVRAEGRR